MSWVDLCSDDLAEGDLREARAGEVTLGVARVGGRLHAFEVWCTHAECPLTDGWLEGDAVRCACHGSLFHLETGEPREGPAEEPLRVFRTRVVGGRIEAELPATSS